MMRELLRRIAERPGQSSRELAERLAAGGIPVDKSLVEIAILELEQKGYLRRESQAACAPAAGETQPLASAACTRCPLRCAGRSASSWVLTDKARALN